MWELVEIYLGNGSIIDSFPTLVECQMAAAREFYIADRMASFICEVEV